jgi:hypothetical protein
MRLIVLCLLNVVLPCHYEGTAYASGDGHVVYKEEHFQFEDGNGVRTRLVLYRCPSGEPFARKWVRDSHSDEAPDFELLDARSGYREGVRSSAQGREAFVQSNRESPLRTSVLPERSNPVIDAGFDAFVSNHWSEFGEPGKGRMAFVVPSRLGYLDMRVKSAQSATLAGEPVVRVRLGVDTWFGFIAPTIDITYAGPDHMVRRFEGIGNILDAAGKRQNVRIEFPPSGTLRAPTSQDIERAAALPLSTGCASVNPAPPG